MYFLTLLIIKEKKIISLNDNCRVAKIQSMSESTDVNIFDRNMSDGVCGLEIWNTDIQLHKIFK